MILLYCLPLSTWSAGSGGDLVGELSMPIRVATVGGTLHTNAATGLAVRLSGVQSSQELAELMAAVGLAQNFAAIRALATRGIQEGHMKLHARSTASARDQQPAPLAETMGTAAGKVILLGEHAVVYGRHAVALPIADAVTASVSASDKGSSISIPQWGLKQAVTDTASGAAEAVQLIFRELAIDNGAYSIDVRSKLPRGLDGDVDGRCAAPVGDDAKSVSCRRWSRQSSLKSGRRRARLASVPL